MQQKSCVLLYKDDLRKNSKLRFIKQYWLKGKKEINRIKPLYKNKIEEIERLGSKENKV